MGYTSLLFTYLLTYYLLRIWATGETLHSRTVLRIRATGKTLHSRTVLRIRATGKTLHAPVWFSAQCLGQRSYSMHCHAKLVQQLTSNQYLNNTTRLTSIKSWPITTPFSSWLIPWGGCWYSHTWCTCSLHLLPSMSTTTHSRRHGQHRLLYSHCLGRLNLLPSMTSMWQYNDRQLLGLNISAMVGNSTTAACRRIYSPSLRRLV